MLSVWSTFSDCSFIALVMFCLGSPSDFGHTANLFVACWLVIIACRFPKQYASIFGIHIVRPDLKDAARILLTPYSILLSLLSIITLILWEQCWRYASQWQFLPNESFAWKYCFPSYQHKHHFSPQPRCKLIRKMFSYINSWWPANVMIFDL